jgi:guanine deaminase
MREEGRIKRYMAEAIDLAEQGMNRGDGGPFGAVVIEEDEIIGRGWNRVLATNDPTAHAEVVALRAASRAKANYWLEGCILVVNCEPCPMCLAAMYWARIAACIYGASRDDAAAIGFDDAFIYEELERPRSNRRLRLRQFGQHEAASAMQRWQSCAHHKAY